MKKYKVRLFYHTNVDVDVYADNEKGAIEEAYSNADTPRFYHQFETNAEVDNDPEILEEEDFDDKRLTDKQKEELGYN